MDTSQTPQDFEKTPAMGVILSILISVALVGFLIGVNEPVQKWSSQNDQNGNTNGKIDPHSAPNYSSIGQARRDWETKPTHNMSALENFGETKTFSDREKSAAFKTRFERRAFDGAPPVIPHAVDSRRVQDCMVCHAEGLVIGDKRAKKMPHEMYASCTQCHVESDSSQFSKPFGTDNSFQGIQFPEKGERNAENSPPVIPHTIHMRNDCMSCHSTGEFAFSKTHTWTNNCLKCHAVNSPREAQNISNNSEADRQKSLKNHGEKRAFAGAPPVITHEIRKDDAKDCLSCHTPEKRQQNSQLRSLPHPYFSSCTQCHVAGKHSLLPAKKETKNSFQGLKFKEKGSRAWKGAPPTIPHTTDMRTNCLSCHGNEGINGLKTTHPERGSCTQCHVSSHPTQSIRKKN